MFDVVIRGGTVLDGNGTPAVIADVAIKGDRIAEIGKITSPGKREINATGLLVTPGWVDIHTHYDGQATWDQWLDPSFSSGVTTAIMGNCGVGFAPVRKGSEQKLIDLMDGVEEIPGSALSVGLKWNWESFTDYLDVIAAKPRSFDIGALIPHGPLRLYVMGDKVGGTAPANDDEIAEMVRLAEQAMQHGAFGLSSTRTPVHRTVNGEMTPDYAADERELTALAEVVARHGGIMEFAPEGLVGEGREALDREMAMYDRIVANTGVSLHMLVLQPNLYPDYWRQQLDWVEGIGPSGRPRGFAQISGRSIGALLSFFGTHPFMERPGFKAIKALPRDQWLAELAKPEVKAQILGETDPEGTFGHFLNQHWNRCYDLGEEADYEPDEDRNMIAIAAGLGTTPQSATYDMMLQTSRHPRLLLAINNYSPRGLEDLKDMMLRPGAVIGGSDAGAHVMTISDGAMNTFMLTHWGRDRRRGEKLPLELIVRMMSRDTAEAVGIHDRGRLEPGLRADINVIDMDRLALDRPTIVDDLPTGASRLLQAVSGYRATLVGGVVTREHDAATGSLPGGLLRKHAVA